VTTQAARSYGPSALGEGGRRFTELALTMARTEFKLRYFGSVLGYVWSLVRPLLFFTVLYLFFTKVVKLGHGVPHYGLYLLTNIVLWAFLAEATGNAVNCLVVREGLLRKVRFPRMVIPLSVSLTATFNLAMNFVTVIVFALASGIFPSVSWLELIAVAVGFIVLGSGIGMLLSALYVRFRDVAPIWEVALQVWFYGSPVMYFANAYRHFGHVFQQIAMVNPTATLLTQASHALIGGHEYPSAAARAYGIGPVLGAIAVIIFIFALGWWFFVHEAPRVAEKL